MELRELRTRLSARQPWNAWQRNACLGLIPLLAIAAAFDPDTFFVTLSIVLLLFYSLVVGTKVVAVLAGLRKDIVSASPADLAQLADSQCPVYTILVPLYHEAAVVEDLVRALEALDYPKSALDVKLLLEADDSETARKIGTLELPPWIEALTVPDGAPKTKPRACNYGLERARGEFLVVFDAEDRPEPEQLKKAVCGFRNLPENIVCLQAKLNFFNRGHSLLTRLFTLEYTAWFDLYLPGLHALGAPIPLGGTSNHFRTAALREIGGWDAYNVTEDCDLGLCLEWAGKQTHILDSTTWEEAPARWWAWIRQRSRWLKGYWQTHLVHTKDPRLCLRALGVRKTLLMLFTIGGQVLSLLINPACWVVAAAWAGLQWPLFDPNRPWTLVLVVAAVALLLSNVLFIAVHMLGAAQRGFKSLVPVALLLPFYWLMLSVGAWRGFLQFFYAPFLWEKTQHGLAQDAAGSAALTPASAPPPARRWRQRLASATVVLSLAALIGLIAWRTPVWLKYYDQIRYARIEMLHPDLQQELPLDESWLGKERLSVDVSYEEPPPPPEQEPERRIFRAVLNLKVWDGEWYQLETSDIQLRTGGATLGASLLSPWQGVGNARPWCPDCLRRVRAVGVRFFGDASGIKNPAIRHVEASGRTPLGKLHAALLNVPATGQRGKMLQVDFELNRAYQNPFDPEAVDLWGIFTAPAGNEYKIPAFYNQDYTRRRDGAREVLVPHGKPYWSVRFTPPSAGAYTLAIRGGDKFEGKAATAPVRIEVADSNERGFVQVDPGKHFFSFQNGDFYYPLGINIRSPRDDIDHRLGDFPEPAAGSGTFAMDEFIGKMAAAKMNFGRFWSVPWFCGLEWSRDWEGYHGLGVYNLQNAWRMDHLLETAAGRNMLLEIAINSHGPFTMRYDSQWKDNPYNEANGGPLQHPAEIMTQKDARRWMKNRLRYLAARYGANPSLFGWTLWIECETVNNDPDELKAWHKEMASYLKELDCGKHIISTEFNGSGVKQVCELPEIEYVQVGAYSFGRGLVDQFKENTSRLLRYGKPIVLEEYGGHAQGGSMRWIGQEIHDGLWTGWIMRIGAAPMAWWWNLIFARDLQRHYRRFADFTAGEDLRGVDWQHVHQKVDGPDEMAALIRAATDRAYIWVYSPQLVDFRIQSREYWRASEAASRAYAAAAGEFDALAEKPGAQFPPRHGCGIDLSKIRLAAGKYEIEFWDTWTQAPPEKRTIEITEKMRRIELPELSRDIAIKLKRIPAGRTAEPKPAASGQNSR